MPPTFKTKGYWLTTADMAKVYGVATKTIHSRMLSDKTKPEDEKVIPKEETYLGRSKVWDRVSVKRHLENRGMPVPDCISSLGIKKPVVEDSDELLDVDDVMAIFDYSSRPEFQHRVRDGMLPAPDYRYQRPFPSFWLRSSIERWIEQRKSTLSYKRLSPGHYQVSYGAKVVGEVEKFVLRVDSVREASGELVEREVIRWRSPGSDAIWDSRKRASMSLLED